MFAPVGGDGGHGVCGGRLPNTKASDVYNSRSHVARGDLDDHE